MKINTISFMQRKNLGNYEHAEASISAQLDEGEDTALAMLKLQKFIQDSLNGDLTAKEDVKPTPVVPEIKEEVKEEVVVETPKKKKASKTKEVQVEAPKSNLVAYDRNIENHKQLLSSYLTKNFPDWKTKEGVREFSASLVGKDYLDESGNIVESFKQVLSGFFA